MRCVKTCRKCHLQLIEDQKAGKTEITEARAMFLRDWFEDLCFYCIAEDRIYHIDLNRYQSLDRPKGCLYPKEHGSQSSSSSTRKKHKSKHHN